MPRTNYHTYLWLFSLFLLPFLAFEGAAQDARFSQFNQNPLHLNPALTGFYNGGVRVQVNYRTLYYSVLNDQEYVSYSGSAENRFPVNNSYASFGAMILHDQVGVSGYERTYYYLSGAYHQRLTQSGFRSPDMFLAVGGQLGMGQYAFEPSDLWFSSQYNDLLQEINRTMDSGEVFAEGGSNRFLDYNAGLLWYMSHPEGGGAFLGGALHHFSEPNVGLLRDSPETLNRRITVHAGGDIPLGRYVNFLPAAVWRRQGPTQSAMAGANFQAYLGDGEIIKFRVGAWLHLTENLQSSLGPEAVIVTSAFEWDGWRLGLSYDATVSPLRRSNFARGAFEISLAKIMDTGNRAPKVICPEL